MAMTPDILQAEIERFMVPLEPPDGAHEPELGWPDGVTLPPAPYEGTTPTDGSGLRTFAASGLPAGALAGGYASAPPYWQGAAIVSNTATSVTVDEDAAHPDGPQEESVVVEFDGQSLFQVNGGQEVKEILSVEMDGVFFAVNADHVGTDLSIGRFALHAEDAFLEGQVLDVVYVKSFGGPVPAGVDYVIAPPKAPVAGLSTGDAWAAAYRALIEAGAANGVQPIPGTLAAAEAAMKAVVDGMMSTPGLAAASLQAGAAAFWGVVAASAATIFPGAVGAVPPAGLAGMSAAVLAAGVSALALPIPDPWDDSASVAAAALFASALHSTSLGGLVVFQPGPSPVPSPFV